MATGLPARKASDHPEIDNTIKTPERDHSDIYSNPIVRQNPRLMYAIFEAEEARHKQERNMGYIPPPPPGQNAGFYETNSLPPPISEPVPDERPLPYDRDLLMTVNERAVMQLFWLVGFVGMLVGIVTGEILLDVLSAIALAAAIWLSREPTKRKRKNDEKPKRGRLMVGDDGELIEEDSYPTPPEPEPGQYPPGGITVSRYSVLPLYSPSDTSNRKGIK